MKNDVDDKDLKGDDESDGELEWVDVIIILGLVSFFYILFDVYSGIYNW